MILWEMLQDGVELRAYPFMTTMANSSVVRVECDHHYTNNPLRGHLSVKLIIPIIAIVAVAFISISTPTFAMNWTFMENSAVQKFNDEDWQLFSEAGKRALEATPDGQTVEWENPATASEGQITPVSTSEKDGVQCRKVEIANSAGGFSGESVFTFCKDPDSGDWKAIP
ncbi:MAG: RT0821/Lpp0805 family surface protein [Candidatus Competibacteraceae bacterium]|jgi:surface antigen|nr:RT0821/Lpp0805 family surface protein [Candidatus Competibacteraceae bacterium]